MPATQQRMAAAVLAHPFRAATASIDDFAGAAAVSIASANRFAVALGFRGYVQFRAELARAFETTLAPVERLRSGLAQPAADSAEAMAGSLDEDRRNLERIREALMPASCERAVDLILAARRVNTMGFGASAFLAGLLHHELDAYCADVVTLAQMAGPTHAARQIFKLGPEDLLILIVMPRYSEDALTLAGLARERGCKILALTDQASSPVVALADQVLYVPASKQMSATSSTATLACIEALCAAVARRTPQAVVRVQELTRFVMPWLHLSKSGPPMPTQRAASIGKDGSEP